MFFVIPVAFRCFSWFPVYFRGFPLLPVAFPLLSRCFPRARINVNLWHRLSLSKMAAAIVAPSSSCQACSPLLEGEKLVKHELLGLLSVICMCSEKVAKDRNLAAPLVPFHVDGKSIIVYIWVIYLAG